MRLGLRLSNDFKPDGEKLLVRRLLTEALFDLVQMAVLLDLKARFMPRGQLSGHAM